MNETATSGLVDTTPQSNDQRIVERKRHPRVTDLHAARSSSTARDAPVPLERVISTPELGRRPHRVADHERENRALVALAEHMEQSPKDILRKLVETAMQLCSAGSAGVSIIEPDGGPGIFRWHALAGEMSSHLWGTTPRNFSPCGTVVDHNTVELMSFPERHFTYFIDVKPTIVEALLVPFNCGGRTVGTIWVVTHEADRHFDAEDARLVVNLGKFAAAAYQVTSSLQRINDDERHRGAFLATVAHELRSPLGALQNAVQYLHLRRQDLPDSALREAHDLSQRQVRVMARMIDDLLDVARIDGDRVELRYERVALAAVVRDAIETSRPHIDAAHHKLSVTLPSECVWIDCDPMRLAQSITNLLDNAAKYMADGGRIEVSAEQTQTEIVIRVRDEGIGIPADMLSRIFDLFVQVDATRNRGQSGLGIGLNLVKRLIELHGGTVAAYSGGSGGQRIRHALPKTAQKR